jgi:metallo-beta-lactamase class B
MKRKEFLLERYYKKVSSYYEKNKEFNTNPSIARVEPFKIADGLYYVGDKKVCIHLIDTGDGLILLDSGYIGATHLLVDSIWRAGFDPKNVRWIIHTHGHSDHFGASDEFRRMYGAKLAISKVDAESLRDKPHRAHINNDLFPYVKTPAFDYEIEDGEIFELGNVKIRCVLTPGHTAGVLSLFFNVTDNGNEYLAGLFGGAGVNALTLPYICYNEDPEDCPQQMLNSIEKIWNEPVVVHLGNHPYNSCTFEKYEKQLKEGGNPFIAPDSWHKFLGELKEKVEKIIEDNEKLEKEVLLG